MFQSHKCNSFIHCSISTILLVFLASTNINLLYRSDCLNFTYNTFSCFKFSERSTITNIWFAAADCCDHLLWLCCCTQPIANLHEIISTSTHSQSSFPQLYVFSITAIQNVILTLFSHDNFLIVSVLALVCCFL